MNIYPIENRINKSIIQHCKSLEGRVVINGSILAKNLSSMVALGLLTEQQKKIYDCLTDTPKDTNTISKETKIDSIQVATQLRRINKMTQLVNFKIDYKNKLWFKYKIV
jgi:hypothetical protein